MARKLLSNEPMRVPKGWTPAKSLKDLDTLLANHVKSSKKRSERLEKCREVLKQLVAHQKASKGKRQSHSSCIEELISWQAWLEILGELVDELEALSEEVENAYINTEAAESVYLDCVNT